MQTKKFLILVNLKTDYNAKITDIESKIPSITGLATAAALNTIENKIPDISNLVKKADYDAKILDIKLNILLQLVKLQAYYSSYFRGKSHFEDDGTQNYLVYQPRYRYF